MISGKDYEKIKSELEDALHYILYNTPQLEQVREVKTAVDMYKKSRNSTIEPATILKEINGLILGRVSQKISDLSNVLAEKLDGLDIEKSQDGVSVSKPLLGIKISTGLVLVANGIIDVGKITIDLEFDIDFAVEKMRVTNIGGKKQFEIGRIIFTTTLNVLTEAMIRIRKIPLAKKEFELQNIVLTHTTL